MTPGEVTQWPVEGQNEWRTLQLRYPSHCLKGSTSWFTKARFHRARRLYERRLGITSKPLSEHFSQVREIVNLHALQIVESFSLPFPSDRVRIAIPQARKNPVV